MTFLLALHWAFHWSRQRSLLNNKGITKRNSQLPHQWQPQYLTVQTKVGKSLCDNSFTMAFSSFHHTTGQYRLKQASYDNGVTVQDAVTTSFHQICFSKGKPQPKHLHYLYISVGAGWVKTLGSIKISQQYRDYFLMHFSQN